MKFTEEYRQYLKDIISIPKVFTLKAKFNADQLAEDLYFFLLAPMGW